MFLRSLHIRGFKSFADKTVLEFAPGVSVIVGPNGSGKSNLVDAISWVLGEQGPRALRGGQMADVIFAGHSGGGDSCIGDQKDTFHGCEHKVVLNVHGDDDDD